MDALEFLKEWKRMCDSCNDDCELFKQTGSSLCKTYSLSDPKLVVTTIENWSKEHPRKTILMDFLEKYPNAPLDEKGFPKDVCPFALGYEEDDCGVNFTDKCFDCWNRPMEVKE